MKVYLFEWLIADERRSEEYFRNIRSVAWMTFIWYTQNQNIRKKTNLEAQKPKGLHKIGKIV
jgi:hypothetical protein